MSKDTYRIGEAAKQLELATSVLRYWETEFPQLAPQRTPKGQRVYTAETMATLFRLKELLHVRGMTIEGARRILEQETEHTEEQAAPNVDPALVQLQNLLESRGMTVENALRILSQEDAASAPVQEADSALLQGIRSELVMLREQLRARNKENN
jgi:DNA-binding transcriptional MerR regulator